MNKNLTMSIDGELIDKVKKIANEKNTTVSTLIRNFLQRLIEKQAHEKNQSADELEKLFNRSSAQIGVKAWSRDELHDR